MRNYAQFLFSLCSFYHKFTNNSRTFHILFRISIIHANVSRCAGRNCAVCRIWLFWRSPLDFSGILRYNRKAVAKAGCGFCSYAVLAQLVEHILGKDEVAGSTPVNSLKTGASETKSPVFLYLRFRGREWPNLVFSNISPYKSGTYYFVMGERKLLFSLPQAPSFRAFER